MLVVRHPESGELAVLVEGLSSPLMRGADGAWRRDIPSGADLRDVYETVVDRDEEAGVLREALRADAALPPGRAPVA